MIVRRAGPWYRASAPVRLDLAGGWSDVAPFALRERGAVVNAAIGLRARVELRPGGERYRLAAHDLGQTVDLPAGAALSGDGPLGLLKAALRLSAIGPCELATRSEAPPGSGLGSSGALDVALVAALDAARGIERSPEALAEEAFRLESVEAGLPGGRQDQYAAALGGFLRLGFEAGAVRAERLCPDPGFLAELERGIVVCYTGVSRVSSRTIERVMGAYQAGDPVVASALRSLARIAGEMAAALAGGDLRGVGALLGENWRRQQALDRDMRTAEMARLEEAMASAGVLGGKAAGAGAGGSMFFLVEDPARAARLAREAGASVLPVRWEPRGAVAEGAP